MPQLVMTSCVREVSLALVVVSAAALGSTRPMALPDQPVPPPEVPEQLYQSATGGHRYV